MKIQDFELIIGDTGFMDLVVTDNNGNPADLTGITGDGVKFVLYDEDSVVLTKTIGSGVTLSDPDGGLVEIKLSPAETATLLGDYTYKIVVTTLMGDVYTVASGAIEVLDPRPIKGYCSVADVVGITGSTLEHSIIQGFINGAKRVIDNRIKPLGLTGSVELRDACLMLSVARMLVRYRMDGTKPNTLTIGAFSMSDNIDQAIAGLRAEAFSLVDDFVNEQTRNRGSPEIVRIER